MPTPIEVRRQQFLNLRWIRYEEDVNTGFWFCLLPKNKIMAYSTLDIITACIVDYTGEYTRISVVECINTDQPDVFIDRCMNNLSDENWYILRQTPLPQQHPFNPDGDRTYTTIDNASTEEIIQKFFI